MSKLIITADDYGYNSSCNKAILGAVSAGLVTSVHVMANYADEFAIKQLVTAINDAGNKCGIGLHVNTTSGPAAFQEENSLTKWNNLNQRYHFRDITDFNYDPSQAAIVQKEVNVQFEKLADIIGAENIDCISSHHNIHFFSEDFFNVLLPFSAKAKIPMRSAVRWEADGDNKTYKFGKNPMPIAKSGIQTIAESLRNKNLKTVAVLKNAIEKKTMEERRKVANSNGASGKMINSTSGHWYGQPSTEAISWMIEQLSELKTKDPNYVTEIFMHLADSEKLPDAQKLDVLTYGMSERKMEYLTLMSQDIKTMLHKLYDGPDVQFGSYRKLLQGN
ncbi:MAG: ChbG/HpnK family deacetylase [Fluviicola sp.]|nr:ChbG/HpnK family deacetylase [Fluviicola sp.]